MSLSGAHVRMIGEGVLDDTVFGIAATSDVIAVGLPGKVTLFDAASGDLIRSIGDAGSAEGQLTSSCCGLRFTPDGNHVIITEMGSDRLSLFTLSGDFVRCIGVGLISTPLDVDFTSNGDILVPDCDGNRIYVLSSDGFTLLRTFGVEGFGPGQFKTPTALAVHGDLLYVLDRASTRVQVFT